MLKTATNSLWKVSITAEDFGICFVFFIEMKLLRIENIQLKQLTGHKL